VKGPAELHILEGIGLELEYMIVEEDSLDVLPVADRALRALAGKYTDEFLSGTAGWSNELVLHVMELKNVVPVSSLHGLVDIFHGAIGSVNRILGGMGARLMPTGMHPWMDPRRETRVWRRRNRRIYEAYDRIFGCSGHGWANIQSVHLNLSFSGDEEFRKLHAAVRLLLPLLPFLAASSPIVEGKITGTLDNRLIFYMTNQKKIPSISGRIIPENSESREKYERRVLHRMYRDIAPFDPEGILRHEWLNSRGAVPRFARSAIELRLLDVQECPLADISVAAVVAAVLRGLLFEGWSYYHEQAALRTATLRSLLLDTMRSGQKAVISEPAYLRAFGVRERRIRVSELWEYLGEEVRLSDLVGHELWSAFRVILDHGALAQRIIRATGKSPSRERLREVYRRLCKCLSADEQFLG
jgi:glutamate---cysteine ligase / carboxylate-amine ligase